jgi:hypothetical protein
LVKHVGRAQDLGAVHDELQRYFSDGRNHTFLRRRLKLRICTSRLKGLVMAHFKAGERG